MDPLGKATSNLFWTFISLGSEAIGRGARAKNLKVFSDESIHRPDGIWKYLCTWIAFVRWTYGTMCFSWVPNSSPHNLLRRFEWRLPVAVERSALTEVEGPFRERRASHRVRLGISVQVVLVQVASLFFQGALVFWVIKGNH